MSTTLVKIRPSEGFNISGTGFCMLIIMIILFAGCQKNNEYEIPELVTSAPVKDGDSLILRGKILSTDNESILSFGFVIEQSDNSKPFPQHMFVCNQEPAAGPFTVKILSDFSSDSTFNVRSFAELELDYIYGNGITFEGTGSYRPTITDFLLKEGFAGDFIKITGKDLGRDTLVTEVFFGDMKAKVTSANSNELLVKVPVYKWSGIYDISVVKTYDTVYAEDAFFMKGPVITGFSQSSGNAVVNMQIEGNGFSPDYWQNDVWLGPYEVDVTGGTENSLNISFPAQRLWPGDYNFTVRTNQVQTLSDETFWVENLWHQVSPCPQSGMSGGVNFTLDEKLYICTGKVPVYYPENKMFAYDPVTDQWTEKERFPEVEFKSVTGFTIGNKAYVCVTDPEVTYGEPWEKALWEYDPIVDKWTHKENFPGDRRYRAFGISYNGHGYVGLGSGVNIHDFWRYDPVMDEWQQMPDFPGSSRVIIGELIISDELYIIGGTDDSSKTGAGIWKFNFNNQEWQNAGFVDLNIKAVFTSGELCYLLALESTYMGNGSGFYLYSFDPVTNQVIQDLGLLPMDKRQIGFVNSFDNQLYFGLGETYSFNNYFDEVWKYEK